MCSFEMLSIEDIFSMDPESLIQTVSEHFQVEIPPYVDSIEDMANAGRLLGQCASNYSYLLNMAMAAKIRKRHIKRDGGSRQEAEDALSREEIFNTYAEIMKTAYNAISRMITIKQEINEELHFTDGR